VYFENWKDLLLFLIIFFYFFEAVEKKRLLFNLKQIFMIFSNFLSQNGFFKAHLPKKKIRNKDSIDNLLLKFIFV